MRPILFLLSVAAGGLGLAVLASPARGQTGGIPTISSRQFVGGSGKLTVTGSFQIDEDVAINTKASYSDGESTWLQFGDSGAQTPNALITYAETGVGIIIGKGKFTATGEFPACSGKVVVTSALVSGQYTGTGVTSYNPGTGKMGNIDITIRFTAKT